MTAQLKHVLQVHGSQVLRPYVAPVLQEETLDCSPMIARSQMRKQVEIAFNKGCFPLHHHHGNTIKNHKSCALTEMDILITMISQWKLVAI